VATLAAMAAMASESERGQQTIKKWFRFFGQFFIGFNEDCPAV